MDRSVQVKQYVAELQGLFCRFRVFESGEPGFYLFDVLDPSGCSSTIQFPVRKSELHPDVRSALAHGWGHA